MRAAGLRSRVAVAIAGVLLAAVAGCSSAPAVAGPAVPTFAPQASVSADAAAGPIDPCAALITPEDVAGVLGLDPAKVNLRTVVGRPAPAVGRTNRIDCAYTGEKGRGLFDIRASTYDTTISAGQQWMLNLGQEDGDRRDVTVGTAGGYVFSRKGEQLLTVLLGNRTLALELPDATAPHGRAKENLIIDFAQRALKVEPDPAPTAGATTPPPAAAPVPGATG